MHNWCAPAAVAAALFCAGHATAVSIDTFETSQSLLAATSGTPTNSSVVSGAGIVGGDRFLEAQYGSGPGAATVVVNDGRLAYGAAMGTAGGGRVVWDSDGAGLAGVDLTDGGVSKSLFVDVFQADSGTTLTFTVEDTLSNVLTGALVLPPNITTPTTFELPFGELTGAGVLTSVVRVELAIDAPIAATDLILESVRTDVPGPGAPAAVALAGVLCAARKRRR